MRTSVHTRALALFLVLVMAFSLLPVISLAAEARQTIAAWEFSGTQDSAASVDATTGSGSFTHSSGTVAFVSDGCFNAKGWSTDAYWQISGVDTTGMGNLQLSVWTRSSGTGPANWAVDYSADSGASWTNAGGYTITNSSSNATFTVDLPDGAICESLMLRIHPTDTVSVNGGTVASGGTNRIGKVTISGTAAGVEALGSFTFTGATALPAAATEGWGYLGASPAGSIAYTTAALSMNKWTVDAYWLMIFNTSGCTGLKLDFDVLSSGTGPANFAVEYSTDNNETWSDPVATYTIENTGKLQHQSVTLPDTAQSTNLMIRLRVTDDTACKSTEEAPATIASSGTSKINNITLAGSPGAGREADPEEPIWPAGWYETNPDDPENPAPLPGFVNAEVVGDPIAVWQFTGAANLPADANTGYWGTLTHWNSSYIGYTSGMLSQTGWTEGGYWQIVANTSGCTDMTFQMRTTSSSTGPRDWSLRYSTDLGETWVEFAALSITSSAKNYVAKLPDAAQSENLVIRMVVASGVSIKGDAIKNGGNNKLNNIAIYGVAGEGRLENPEEPQYPADWSLPEPYDADKVFVPEYDEAANVSGASTDETTRRTIAKWGGNANYEGAMFVYGDLISANDRLDGGAKVTVNVAGAAITPGFSTSSTNSTNYFLGSKSPCVGSGPLSETLGGTLSDDYIQMAVSTAKFAELGLSFRLRVSGSGPKGFAAKFSTDGEYWSNFNAGSYSYSYTGYGYGGQTYEVTGEGTIEGGYIPMEIDSQYEEVTLEVPIGAENAKTLYIRLYADHLRCDGKVDADTGEALPVGSTASVRIDTIELTGCPMIHEKIADWVKVDVEGAVPAGQELTMTSATEGAVIRYSFDHGKTVRTYNPDQKPVLTEFPVLVTVWAEKDGLYPSVKTSYYYTQAQCNPVKATPNGGAVVAGMTVKLSCATEGATILYTFDGVDWQTYDPENRPELTEALLENELTMMVMAVKEGYLSSPISTLTFTRRLNAEYNLYFGQLHSHTNLSDGAGSCEEAFVHASTEVANLDFLAVTDHSNAFDNDLAASIYDGSMSQKWLLGHELADKYTTENFVCLYGFEMTWSNGLGHMNTYNTAGFQSRTQAEFSSFSTALRNYYDALKSDTNSLAQFNHPGTTFGTFQDYSYFDEDIDALITIIEVGNGEGAIGSSGYFPSYEEYTRALDLGWHIAPTNNQDNHKGAWGDSNTARSVVMADSLTRNNIYDAIRNRRVYATEDNDFSVYYTLNGYEMGTILTEDDVDGEVYLEAKINDPTDSGNCLVEVIVNGGLVAASKTVSMKDSVVNFELAPNYSYYYLRLTQADKNIAVTAPVWIGEVESIGIKEFAADSTLLIQNEPTEISFRMFNNEDADLVIDSIEFTMDNETVHTVNLAEAGLDVLAAGTERAYFFDFTCSGIGAKVLYATVKATFNGVPKQYVGKLEMKYVPASIVSNVIVDGTHYNDYITGNYLGNYTKLVELGEGNLAKVRVITDEITREMLNDCDLLIITPPAKRTKEGYQTSHFEDSFIANVADYVSKGGTVVLCGSADYNDSTVCQTHTEMNKLLTAMGATIKLRSDELVEPKLDKDGLPVAGEIIYGLELGGYNAESKWLEGAAEEMTFAVYSACSIDMSANQETDAVDPAEALILGNASTYSIDAKTNGGQAGSGATVVSAGNVIAAAVQHTKAQGDIFLVGSIFFSDYDMETDEHDYKLNAVLMENILKATSKELPVTPIAEMRKGAQGDVFCVEGRVTNGTDNEFTKFFDTIYIQDETGGTTVYPYAQLGLKRGALVQIVGYVDAYQDDLEIQVLRARVLDNENLVDPAPTELSCADAMDYAVNGGLLVKTKGEIVDISYQGESVTQIRLKDATGVATIFIDGYIYSGTTGENRLAEFCKLGAKVSAVGMCFMHPETGEDFSSCCLRVRDCDEIVLLEEAPEVVKTLLAQAIEQAEALHKADYTAESWAALSEALFAAKDVYDDPDATQAQVDAATEALLAAIDALVPAGGPGEEADKTALAAVIANAKALLESLNGTYYTDATWQALVDALAAAEAVYDDPAATQEQVDNAAEMLQNAINKLLTKWDACDGALLCPGKAFTDMPAFGDWAHKPIDWAVVTGVTTGTSTTTFSPNKGCTRAQVVTFLWRAAGQPDVAAGTANPFKDVASDQYYYNAVLWAVQNGITTGTSTTTFSPNSTCTRAQIVTFLYRYAGQPEVPADTVNPFKDVKATEYYYKAVLWASGCGVTTGTSATTFSPNNTCTRAQVVTFLFREMMG